MDRFPSGHLRVSDAERDRAISDLSEHFQAGRLTMEEFEERSDQAVHAKTYADLAGLFHDLPRIRRQVVPAPEGRPAPRASSTRLGPLVATLVSALVAVAVSLLSVTEPHHRFVVVVPIVLWLLVVRRLVRVYDSDGPGNGPNRTQ